MTKPDREFKKLFNRIDYSIKIKNLYYRYEKSYLDFNHKGRIYFKDKIDNKYCVVLEKPILNDYPEIQMHLYSCGKEHFLIDYDNKIFYQGFYPSIGYRNIGNIFINAIDDYFSGLYTGYNIGRLKEVTEWQQNRNLLSGIKSDRRKFTIKSASWYGKTY